jgi:carbon storage regulator CsrA
MFLVLSRKAGERVVLIQDGKVLGTVMFADTHGDKIRLALDFPPEVKIWREEVWAQINQGIGKTKGGA